MNTNCDSKQQNIYNEHNPATPVAEDHTYHTIWDECFDKEIEQMKAENNTEQSVTRIF